MPKQRLTLRLELTCERARLAVLGALTELEWDVLEEGEQGIVAKEGWSGWGLTTSFPVQVEIAIEPAGGGAEVELLGSVGGFGPIQSGHLGERMAEFERLLRRAAAHDSEQGATLGDQLQKLIALRDIGELTEEEFRAAKLRLVGDWMR